MTDARFEAYGTAHLVVLAVFAVGLVVMPVWGRSHRGTGREQPLRRTYAVVVGVLAVGMQAFQLTPGDYDVDTSLPFQLSDLSYVAAVVALWTRSPRATAFTYYVGLTLTVQALLTPSLAEGFPHPRFFGFFLLHGAVVWSAVYLTWGLGIRPTWALYRWTVAATLGVGGRGVRLQRGGRHQLRLPQREAVVRIGPRPPRAVAALRRARGRDPRRRLGRRAHLAVDACAAVSGPTAHGVAPPRSRLSRARIPGESRRDRPAPPRGGLGVDAARSAGGLACRVAELRAHPAHVEVLHVDGLGTRARPSSATTPTGATPWARSTPGRWAGRRPRCGRRSGRTSRRASSGS